MLVVYLAIIFAAAAAFYFFTSRSKTKIVQLTPLEYKEFPLIKKEDVIKPEVGCHTILFRFGLPEGHGLGLPIGQHISIKGTSSEGKLVIRQYTPTTCETDVGHFDVIIKIYPTGLMGNYLKNLPVGSKVGVKGPLGSLHYHGNGQFVIKRVTDDGPIMKKYSVKHIAMIAGGSGITPMYQLIKNITHNPQDLTNVSLCYANQTEGDIMCRKDLEEFAEKSSKIKLYFTVDRPTESWVGGTGYLNADIFKKQFAEPSSETIVLLCGPPPMINAMINQVKSIGYTDDMIFTY